jgi:hypothetical protein
MNTLRNHAWSIALSLFFALLVIIGVKYLVAAGAFYRNFSMADFILLSLAVWRLTRLFTYDAITKFIRDWFVGANPSTLRGTLHTLITCPWCTGLWFAFFTLFFYLATPYAWPVILVLALAAVGSFLQVLSNLVGWHAEYKKVQTMQLTDSRGAPMETGSTCG